MLLACSAYLFFRLTLQLLLVTVLISPHSQLLLLSMIHLKDLTIMKMSLEGLLRGESYEWPLHKEVIFIYSMLVTNELRRLAGGRMLMRLILATSFLDIKIRAVENFQMWGGCSSRLRAMKVIVLSLEKNINV